MKLIILKLKVVVGDCKQNQNEIKVSVDRFYFCKF